MKATKAIKATKKHKGAKTAKEPAEVPYVPEVEGTSADLAFESASLDEKLHVLKFSLDRDKREIQRELDKVAKHLLELSNGVYGVNAEAAVLAAEEYLYGK